MLWSNAAEFHLLCSKLYWHNRLKPTLSLMAIIFPYSNSIAVVTSLAVLPLYHWIPLYNGLMITSRPNVVVIPLFHDSLIISYVSLGYAKKIKISCVLAINYYCTGYAAQALFLQNRHSLVLYDMGFPLYRAGTVLCIHVTRCTFINWLLKLNQTANELQKLQITKQGWRNVFTTGPAKPDHEDYAIECIGGRQLHEYWNPFSTSYTIML